MGADSSLKNDLYRIAMDALVELPVRERRQRAVQAADVAADPHSPARALDRLVGVRAATALRTRLAAEPNDAPAPPPWKPGKQPTIAISTAEETLTEAEQLRSELQRLGAGAWLYTIIPLGRRIIDEAERAMTEYDYVVLMASAASEESDWVQFETALVQQAEFHDRRDRLLPVRVRIRARDLRPYLRLARNIEWEERGGAAGVARAVWERVEADRRSAR